MDSNIRATSSQQRAYAYLKAEIASLRFRPHQRIKALEIAHELGLSRTPVKEALSRLEQEGLVTRELGSGYVVESISAKQVFDLYRVREALEVEAAREALPHIDDTVLRKLERMIADSEPLLGQGLYDEFLRASRAFHNQIAEAAGNDVLMQILGGLNDRIWSIGSIVVRKQPERAREIMQDNRRILDALRARDPDALERAVAMHIKGAGESVRRFVETELQHMHIAAA